MEAGFLTIAETRDYDNVSKSIRCEQDFGFRKHGVKGHRDMTVWNIEKRITRADRESMGRWPRAGNWSTAGTMLKVNRATLAVPVLAGIGRASLRLQTPQIRYPTAPVILTPQRATDSKLTRLFCITNQTMFPLGSARQP